ncbi:hypothetical protein QVN85_09245 [Oscillibacter valericigenes]|nr:hypothetical protein [Oscillibacter valericigenes]
MPINEKSLIRQMRVNFKGAGYRVGTLMRGGVECLMLNGMQWAVALPYSEAGKDLKAQIVSHTGEMPGKPVKVQKDGVQLEMAGELEKTFASVFAVTSDMVPCRKTCLWLGEQLIWQDSSGRCSLFSPEMTDLIFPFDEDPLERMTDGRRMILTDGEAKAFALSRGAKDSQQEMLDYLSCHDWADVVDEPEEDDGQEEIL